MYVVYVYMYGRVYMCAYLHGEHVYMCMWVYMSVYMLCVYTHWWVCATAQKEVRGQVTVVGALLPLCFLENELGPLAWWQVPIPARPLSAACFHF